MHSATYAGCNSKTLQADKQVCHLQGFIEGKYVPINEGDAVTAGTEVLTAEEIAARKTGTTPKDASTLKK